MPSPIEQQLQDAFWTWFVEEGCTYFGLKADIDFESPEVKATHVARMHPQQTKALASAFEAGVGASGELLKAAMAKAQSEAGAAE